MNDVERLTRLAEDTLGGQRVIRHECLVGNEAAEQLEPFGAVVLPVIQGVVLQRVVPTSQEVTDHHELMRRFPGLLSLWVTYFRVAQHTHLLEAVAFLGTLEGPVLASAVLGFRPVWGYSGRGELPPAIAAFLQEVARSPAEGVAEVAKQQLLHVWNRPA
jgi:hypothetical protein